MQPDQSLESYSLKTNPLKNLLSKFGGFWNNIPRKKKIVISLVGLIPVVVFVYLFVTKGSPNQGGKSKDEIILQQISEGFEKLKIPQRETPFFSLSSKTKSKYGIIPTEVFVLKSQKDVQADFVKENLDTSVPVVLTSVSSKEFQITPKNALGKDQVMNIRLDVSDKENSGHKFDRNYGWTFQTQGKFRVKNTIPGDKKTNVPLNTGIEFTFSQDDYEDPTKFISFEPPVTFRTEQHGEVFSIVPLKTLLPSTIYKVTLSKGLNLKSRNDPIPDDLTFIFQTQSQDEFDNKGKFVSMNLNSNFIQVSPDEPATVGVYAQNWNNDNTVKTEIYKFPGESQFLDSRRAVDDAENSWYSYFSETDKVRTNGLSLVSSADLKMQNKEDVNFLQLPDRLDKGFYLVQFWYDDKKKLQQLWLQSSDLIAYTSVGRRQTLVWVNNLGDQKPVTGATVKLSGGSSTSVTSDNGLAVFNTPQEFFNEGKHYLEVTTEGNGKLLLPVRSLKGQDSASTENRNDYWSYLYHERLLYKPGDTLFFWGVVKKRDGSVPSSVTVGVPSGYSDEAGDLLSTKISPSSDGSFMGKLDLTNLSYGWYSLSMKVNDVEVNQTNFTVTEYVKPEMKIELSGSKNAIFAGEKLDFEGKVSFYDETPAKGIPIKIYSPSAEGDTDVEKETGDKGEFAYSYQSKFSGNTEYYPRYEEVTVSPQMAKESTIEGYGSVMVYGSKLMLTTENSQDGSKAILKGTLNRVDLTNVNNGSSLDVKGPLVPNKEVNLLITKTWWEAVQNGTYYDFIEKVTRPSYDYQRHDEKVVDTKLKTNDKGEISYDFQMEDGKSYEADLSLEDEDKHTLTRREYFYYYKGSDFYGDSKYMTPEIALTKDSNEFSLGEDVDLLVKYKGEEFKDTDKNRFLYFVAGRGRQETYVEDVPELSLKFKSEYVPNVYVGSVIFTGKNYLISKPACTGRWRCSYYGYYDEESYFDGLQLVYKKDDSKLEIKVHAGQEKYEPGSDARVEVTVTKEGVPKSSADVNLALVDQALEAIGGVIKPSALSSLYISVPSEIYYNYYTHKPLFAKPPQAEMGGGGGPREIFKDTAFFGHAKTDSQGVAVFEFKMPDNITTWNIYAQGVDGDLNAGESEGKVITTKDFFVTSNFPHEVLTKDKVFITGNSFGRGVSSGQSVNYDFVLREGEKEVSKLSKSGTTSRDVSFQLPNLSVGDYKASLTGKIGNLDDTLIYPLKVLSSRLDLQTDKEFELSKGQRLNGLNLENVQAGKPVNLVLADTGKGKYYYSLFWYCFTQSNRVEKRVAKLRASQILRDRFDEESCSENNDFSEFVNGDGGLSQVGWGGSDLETTVWATFVDKSLFNEKDLSSYFDRKANEGNSGTVQKIYADWGLTALGKPKINELKMLAENSTTFEEKIIAGLALATWGDTEDAKELYYDVLADYAYSNKPYIRIQRGQTGDQKETVNSFVRDSAYALLLGSMVENTYNEGLYSYLRDYQFDAEAVVIDLAKIAFTEEELAKLPDEDTTVNIKSGKRDTSIELSKGGATALKLAEGEEKNIIVSVSSGKSEIRAYYYLTPESLADFGKDSRLKIERTYQKAKGEGAIKPGDIVEVNVKFDLDYDKSPRGGYQITDHLPSGLIYLENPGLYGFEDSAWFYQPLPGTIRYYFYNSPWWQKYGKKSFTYYTRASSVGTYVGEPAVLQSELDLSVLNFTKEDSVDIAQ